MWLFGNTDKQRQWRLISEIFSGLHQKFLLLPLPGKRRVKGFESTTNTSNHKKKPFNGSRLSQTEHWRACLRPAEPHWFAHLSLHLWKYFFLNGKFFFKWKNFVWTLRPCCLAAWNFNSILTPTLGIFTSAARGILTPTSWTYEPFS